jgi:hypothetical protein
VRGELEARQKSICVFILHWKLVNDWLIINYWSAALLIKYLTKQLVDLSNSLMNCIWTDQLVGWSSGWLSNMLTD